MLDDCTGISASSAAASSFPWAVPKGLPLDPKTNHLAVHTEDHPLSYAGFAGEIPKASTAAARSRSGTAGRTSPRSGRTTRSRWCCPARECRGATCCSAPADRTG